MRLGSKGLFSLIFVSAYAGRFSEPKTPCSLATVIPPAMTTIKMTRKIHDFLSAPNIANPTRRRFARGPTGPVESPREGHRRPCPPEERGLASWSPPMVTSDGACSTSRTLRSATAPTLPPVFHTPVRSGRLTMQLDNRPRHVDVTSNVASIADLPVRELTSHPRRSGSDTSLDE